MNSKWLDVRNALDVEIANGILKPGERLPTEPQLVARFDAGRHSIRRALAALAVEGKVRTHQGSGTYVETPELIRYVIGRRTRFRQNLMQQGLAPGGKLLGHSTILASKKIAWALGIEPDDPVYCFERLKTADNIPVAFVTSYKSVKMFPDFINRRAQFSSVTETYKSYGIDDYVRSETAIYTRQARANEATPLAQHPQMPVMIVTATDTKLDGIPISHSQVAWAGARVRFTFESEPENNPSEANDG
ncbi:phosphonate metabolism transcriptional regulator PhnF [Maritalea sp.]|uniref:phosphonate metabolism transcriptional regulator PhnF n=1 Tax=Maritalea sp. TaxID=2003361 RepID=UPI003EF0BBBA